MSTKEVCILGRGPSVNFLPKYSSDSVKDFLLINDHTRTVNNPEIMNIIHDSEKKIHLMSNNNKAGFKSQIISKLSNIESCIINRLHPDMEKWKENKHKQKKNNHGGVLNNVIALPPLAEDEPYLYSWRGPETNKPEMYTYDKRKIHHMPDSAEKYLIPVAQDKIICNCSYYATLYSILTLKADKIIYFGIDFYNHINIDKKWFVDSPRYLSHEWWNLRLAYEGEHMKILWNKYLTSFFPDVAFEFYTTEESFLGNKKNIKVTHCK